MNRQTLIILLVALCMLLCFGLGLGMGFLMGRRSGPPPVDGRTPATATTPSPSESASAAPQTAPPTSPTAENRPSLADVPDLASPEAYRRALDADFPDEAFAYGGIPELQDPDLADDWGYQVLRDHEWNERFFIGYSNKRKNPLWATYHLPRIVDKKEYHRKGNFRIDSRTEAYVREDDFKGTGYHRGHLVPNGAIVYRFGPQKEGGAYDTFFMSNVMPQTPDLNMGIWRILETKVSEHFADWFDGVWVIGGPIFDDEIETLGPGIEIPDACYKIVVDEDTENGRVRVVAFVIPQDVDKDVRRLSPFLETVDEVERLTGLNFLPALHDPLEDAIESSPADAAWHVDALPDDWFVPSWKRR
jgi:endonuclease G